MRCAHALTWMALLVSWIAAAQNAEGQTASQPSAPPQPVTVAVLDYDAGAPGNPDLGSQIADILTARLSVEQSLALVERAELNNVLEEQKLVLRGLAEKDHSVKVGKLLGAKLLVMGKSFEMDNKLMIISKVIGVETGRVLGTLRTVEMSKPLSSMIMLLAEDIAALISKNVSKLLPPGVKPADPIGEIRAKLGGGPRPSVAVIIPEEHLTRVVLDPAVETEIKRVLIACGFKVIDTGGNRLAGWAKQILRGGKKPWPAALAKADLIVVGEAFSEFAIRTGELVTCVGRAEVNLIDRHSGEILLADRETRRAVDLAEALAGKTALQHAGRKLGLAICRRLLRYRAPAEPSPTTAPASRPAPAGASAAGGAHGFALSALRVVQALAVATAGVAPSGGAPSAPATRPAATRPARYTLFAAPFENVTGQEQYDPAAAGMADIVAILLAQQEHVTMVERQELAALTAEQAKTLKGLTGQKYAVKAGKLLRADTVLIGRLYLVESKLMASVKAVEIATDRVIAADELACRPAYLIEAALGLARRLGKQLSLPLPAIDLSTIDKSPIAGMHFAKALGHYYAGDMDSAIMQLMRTLDLDPNFTEVSFFSGLCYHRLGEYAHAAIEFRRFLKDEPGSPHAGRARELLKEARQREKESGVDRFAPDDANE